MKEVKRFPKTPLEVALRLRERLHGSRRRQVNLSFHLVKRLILKAMVYLVEIDARFRRKIV
jgi:hypothetical protein